MLEKQYTLVTGGSSGLGLAMAERLCEEGYIPILVAREESRLQQAAAGIRNKGCDCLCFAGDITDQGAMVKIRDKLQSEDIRIDFLILNAGMVTPGALADFNNPEPLKACLDTNLWGTILTTYTFAPLLSSGSRVLFISSGFGLMGAAGYAAYCASKAGIINFAAAYRRELLTREIAVHVACPGDIDTPQYQRERGEMPNWMKMAEVRGKPASAIEVAQRILKRCHGRRFLIIPDSEVYLLHLANGLLPEVIRDYLLDKLFPLP